MPAVPFLLSLRLGVLLAAALPACSVNLDKAETSAVARNHCADDGECGAGACRAGACVANEGALSTLLLEISPPLTAAKVGGIRSLQVRTGLERSSDDTQIDLSPTATVHGFLRAPAGCGEPTLPIRVTLTPREEGYGLSTVVYSAESHPTATSCFAGKDKSLAGVSVYEFVVAVPDVSTNPYKCSDGKENRACYDIYVEPLVTARAGDAGAPVMSPECTPVPQFFRNLSVGNCLGLASIKAQELKIFVPWAAKLVGEASLDGWVIDVVQPITGHVLSNRVVLRGADRTEDDRGSGYFSAALRYAPVKDDTPGKELVRLSPPKGLLAPVILAELSGLHAVDARVATFPEIGPFPAAVALDAWVYQGEADTGSNVPVASTVTLTAPTLYGIKLGIFASFSTTVQVAADGKLRANVLPGKYWARVVPPAGSRLAASDSTIEVACEHNPLVPERCAATDPGNPPIRAGLVLRVPRAGSIAGVAANVVDGAPLEGATVQANPDVFGTKRCSAADADAGKCSDQLSGVLDLSLGQDGFVPRPATALTGLGGRFTLDEVDCGECKAGRGAAFDVSVRPPDGVGIPWFLRAGLKVDGDVDLGRVSVPLPIIHRGVVQIPNQPDKPVPVPSALIRAYVLRDEQGVILTSVAGLSSCATAGSSAKAGLAAACIRSVLQIAETRAAADGTFELVIPSVIP